RHKALHRVVGVAEAMALDQVLVDAHGVAAERHLRFDPAAVRLAGRDARRRRRGGAGLKRRSPRGGKLTRCPRRAGGHPGGIRTRPLVLADRLAIDACTPGNLVLADPALEQRLYRDTQMRLQDVHSFLPSSSRGPRVTSRRRVAAVAAAPTTSTYWGNLKWPQVEEFGWPPGFTAWLFGFIMLLHGVLREVTVLR